MINSFNKSFKILDFENNKVITDIKTDNYIICLKKIYHPIYGESLLTADRGKKIKLWII